MSGLFGKFVPMLFRNFGTTRRVGTLTANEFAMLAAKKLRWRLPKELPPFSNTLYTRKDYTIELGNFPDESLYILRQKGEEVYRFDALPPRWIVPKAPTKKNKLI